MSSKKWFFCICCLAILCFSVSAVSLDLETYENKVLGGWLGQMIGNIFGLPTEGHFIQSPGPSSLTYYETIPSHALVDDDTFNEIVWLYALEKYGLDITSAELAQEWKEQISAGDMACANWAARLNIEKGILPPLSGHPSNNSYSTYIDAQIEADIWGLLSPGRPDLASSYASLMSELMNYSDGEYGARFIAAMYALAFVNDDIPTIINKALEFIPQESRYYEVIKASIEAHKEFPDRYRRARSRIISKYYINKMTPSGGWVQADVNGAMVVLALLYGERDFDKTIALAVQLGLDNDCNAATAAGIMGTLLGADKIPTKWSEPLNNTYLNGKRLMNVPYSLAISDIAARTATLGIENTKKNGGTIKEKQLEIADYKIEVPAYNKPWTDDEIASTLCKDWNDNWKIQNIGWDMSPGILQSYEGRSTVFSSHPLDEKTPFAFVRTVTLPAETPMNLKLGVTSFNGSSYPDQLQADWLLKVYANDQLIYEKLIQRVDGKIVWYDLVVSLKEYAGQTVTLRVENYPNNWAWEAAYWDYLDLEVQ